MRFAFASLATHALLVGGMAWFLAHDSGHVEGSAGLSGSTRTRFEVTMDRPAPLTAPAPIKAKALPISDGLPIDMKNEPREIDTPPPSVARSEHSAGDAEVAPIGVSGQAGSGTVVAAKIGDSDRTNRLGLYLQKMTRKIQSNLGSAGYLQFPAHATLLLDLHKDGNVTKITVVESSGDPALDRLAIRAVQESLPFDPWEQDQTVQVPVIFRGAE